MAKDEKHKSVTLDCEFGSCNTGRKVVKLGCKVARTHDLETYDALLTGAQLNVTLKSDPLASGDAPGQGKLADTASVLTGVADVHRLSVSRDEISFGLSFNRDDADGQTLGAMACAKGKLSAVRIGDANSKAEDGEGGGA